MENITAFFFNIVPGGYFLMGLYLLYPSHNKILFEFTKYKHFEGVFLLIFIIISLFIGFTFQYFTLLIKKKILLEEVMRKVASSEEEGFLFCKVEDLLVKKEIVEKIDKNKELTEDKMGVRRQKIFFFIQNYLEANNKNKLLVHFGVRQAFWANTMIASIFLILFGLSLSTDLLIIVALLSIAYVSYKAFYEHLIGVYSIGLTTFVSISVFDNRLKLPKHLNRNF